MRFTLLGLSLIAFAAPDTMRAEGAGTVAEVVTFRLLETVDPAEFAAAASGMSPFLDATGAVISRTLSVDADGLWTDHIIWTDMNAAKIAAGQIMEVPEAAPFMALIDPQSVALRHGHIHYHKPQE